MIRIYGGFSDDVVKKANQKLYEIFEIYHDLTFSNNINDDDVIDGLSLLFPGYLIKRKMKECAKAVDELYEWIIDDFLHTLKPLHEFALYQALSITEEEYKYGEENIHNMIDYGHLYKDDNYDFDENELNTFEFYFNNCFLDRDFLIVPDFINFYNKLGLLAFDLLDFDISEYKDLIPEDIIEDDVELSKLVNNELIETRTKSRVDQAIFFHDIDYMIKQFNHSMQNHSLYKLLWESNGKPRDENTVQILFLDNIYRYCQDKGIDIAKEPNIGRGPVDFKLSQGSLKVLIEVKLASNTAFWHGLEVQTIQYMVQENCKNAIFLVIVYNKKEFEKIKDLEKRISKLNYDYSIEITAYVVDATKNKPSASKLPGKNDIYINE